MMDIGDAVTGIILTVVVQQGDVDDAWDDVSTVCWCDGTGDGQDRGLSVVPDQTESSLSTVLVG